MNGNATTRSFNWFNLQVSYKVVAFDVDDCEG